MMIKVVSWLQGKHNIVAKIYATFYLSAKECRYFSVIILSFNVVYNNFMWNYNLEIKIEMDIVFTCVMKSELEFQSQQQKDLSVPCQDYYQFQF